MSDSALKPERRGEPAWAVALLANRENLNSICGAVTALAAAVDRSTVVDLMINGNQPLVDLAVRHFAAFQAPAVKNLRLRIWSIDLGDKANALNTYLHTVWPGAATTFFVDGYVRVKPDALLRLNDTLEARPDVMAAAAVPSIGRSAAYLADDMMKFGGLHGNLFALKRSTMDTMRSCRFRLPVGLYRTDSTIGAALALGLSPELHQWDALRYIAVDSRATWDIDVAPWWQLSAWRATARRRLRQMQGDIENGAVRNWLVVQRKPLDCLPSTVNQMVAAWVALDPAGVAKRIGGHPLRKMALQQFLQPADWSLSDRSPQLLLDRP